MNTQELQNYLGSSEAVPVLNALGLEQIKATILLRKPDGIAVQLYRTDILVFHTDGTLTLNSGGHRTHTTKKRMNQFLSISSDLQVYQDGSADHWFVVRIGEWDNYIEFFDGMRINPADLTLVTPPAESATVRATLDSNIADVVIMQVKAMLSKRYGIDADQYQAAALARVEPDQVVNMADVVLVHQQSGARLRVERAIYTDGDYQVLSTDRPTFS